MVLSLEERTVLVDRGDVGRFTNGAPYWRPRGEVKASYLDPERARAVIQGAETVAEASRLEYFLAAIVVDGGIYAMDLLPADQVVAFVFGDITAGKYWDRLLNCGNLS